MADLIDRQALIKEINAQRRASKTSFPKRSFAVGDTLQCIYDAPAIDPESLRPKGEREILTDDFDCEFMRCSHCGEEYYNGDEDTVDRTHNFCPNCGADMRGEA